jgi:hypothetical protein
MKVLEVKGINLVDEYYMFKNMEGTYEVFGNTWQPCNNLHFDTYEEALEALFKLVKEE